MTWRELLSAAANVVEDTREGAQRTPFTQKWEQLHQAGENPDPRQVNP